MSGDNLRRREFLQGLGAGALSVFGLAGVAATRLACSDGGDPLLAALTAWFDEPERAGRVGAAWAAQAPQAPTREALLTGLFGDGIAQARELAARDPAALHEQLRAQHLGDFEAGRTAEVGGFVLSLTEVRLCALMDRS
jgi:hypothetical protein